MRCLVWCRPAGRRAAYCASSESPACTPLSCVPFRPTIDASGVRTQERCEWRVYQTVIRRTVQASDALRHRKRLACTTKKGAIL
ncbi:hypothetical protein NDU88_007114 [Pleurodeles waltl]|uniref:Secreted protein n=1 Tax=Pleurodeles waltl TaxID=8319 RepID=A0AAV7N171_PLEWA|nr:hypothetical protein NDU88_007114 [Pleurodeles waltl]